MEILTITIILLALYRFSTMKDCYCDCHEQGYEHPRGCTYCHLEH